MIVSRPTVCVTGAGVGVDSAWEQEKLEVRKTLENAAESPTPSALSRCSSGTLCWAECYGTIADWN